MSLTNIFLSGTIMIILDSIYLSNIGKKFFTNDKKHTRN